MVDRQTPVTMRELADFAEVSQSTVSRVLNQSSTAIPISEETRQRVLAAARQLGYRPNPFARGLRGGSVLLISVMVRDIADPFFAAVISVLATLARANGYGLVLGHAQSSSSEALMLSDMLDTRHCDGIIMLGDLPHDRSVFDQMVKQDRPVVGLCRGQPPEGIGTVNVDNLAGTLLLLQHLRSLGHTRMAFIDGAWIGDITERREAYQAFMQEQGLEWPDSIVVAERNEPISGYRAMKVLLGLPEPPTAVLAGDDTLAIGALRAAFDLGKRVPEQVSISGFDDIDLAAFTIPALTTVRQPVEELAHSCLQLLLNMIEGTNHQAVTSLLRLKPELIIRDSCAPPGCRS